MAAEEHSISIFVSDINNSWRHVASRPKRNIVRVGFGTIAIQSYLAFPQNSIILDPGISELLVDDARDFLESKAWYAARGIPFRRGYLLASFLFPVIFLTNLTLSTAPLVLARLRSFQALRESLALTFTSCPFPVLGSTILH
jgi:hypothetical protein